MPWALWGLKSDSPGEAEAVTWTTLGPTTITPVEAVVALNTTVVALAVAAVAQSLLSRRRAREELEEGEGEED